MGEIPFDKCSLVASIQGKIAIVTGSARGIGAGIAARFGREGAKVVCLDRNPADETVAHIKAEGGEEIAVRCDIYKLDSIEAAVQEVLKTYETIDILVNSAGLSKMAAITEATEADWDYVHNVTLKGTWMMIKTVASTMIKHKYGKIINIASISGCVAFVNQSICCAAKGGVVNMTRELGVELAKYGINVNAITPSVVDPPLFPDIKSPLEGRFLQECIEGHPIGRISTPEDIAGPAVFLASDDASFICGHILAVDGGWTAQ